MYSDSNLRIRKIVAYTLPKLPDATKNLEVPKNEKDFFALMNHLDIIIPDWRGCRYPGTEYLIDAMGDFEKQLKQRGYKSYSLVD